MPPLDAFVSQVSVWFFPVVLAITLHEAAHGFAAHLLGDNTAWQVGRVSLNPAKHIDPFGTILLPAMLLLLGAPFLFGYAKPVPVNLRALRYGRLGAVLVAAAGPAMNLLLAMLAGLAFHMINYVPAVAQDWLANNFKNLILLDAVLVVFNLLPIPPLDGGRILVAILPRPLSSALDSFEPYGLIVIIGLLLILPLLGQQLGINLDFFSRSIIVATNAVIQAILQITFNV